MAATPWTTPNWPAGIPKEISGFDKPVFSLLNESARRFPDKPYTIFNGAVRTFRQVQDTADRLASFLASRNIGKGDRVAIFLPNIPHYPEIYFGILQAGAVCVTCNPLYTPSELSYQLQDSGAKAVFCMDHPQFYPTAVEAIQNTEVETVVVCNIASYLPKGKAMLGRLLGKIPKAKHHEPDHFMFDQAVVGSDPKPPQVHIDPINDPALIIYTGGTTGVPKGAVLTHANFVYDALAIEQWERMPHEAGAQPETPRRGGYHCFLGVLPWYHSFGMTACLLLSAATGSRLICIPDPRAGNPPFTEVLKAVQTYRPTQLIAVPTIFSAFTNHPLLDKFDLSSIMLCVSGGSPLPVEVAQKFEQKTGSTIYEGYGLSETAPVVACNPPEKGRRRFGSVGIPFPNTEIRIMDTETGEMELEQGQDGEIAVSGPQVMQGYWRKPQANAEVLRDIDDQRFFLTGDIGHIDQDGYIVITDRKKDVILVGGFNCYPREVEEVLYQHPAVAQAAVIGVPHPKSGEEVKAFIQLTAGAEASEEDILSFCRERLAGYKRPRTVEFRDELPTSPVGKVLRRVLKDEEQQRRKAA